MDINDLKNTINSISEKLFKGFIEGLSDNNFYYYNFTDNIQDLTVPENKCIYGVKVSKGDFEGIIYIGKSEKFKKRFYQHFTGKNQDGSLLASSLNNKHNQLVQLNEDGFKQTICCYYNNDFTKSTLLGVECELTIIAKEDFNLKANQHGFNIKHWNKRIG